MCVQVTKRLNREGYRDGRSQIPRRGPRCYRTRLPVAVLCVLPLLDLFQPMPIECFPRDQSVPEAPLKLGQELGYIPQAEDSLSMLSIQSLWKQV